MTADVPLALVTGASTGIGRALARQFAEHGFDVVVVADEPRVHDTAEELRATGRQVTAIEADLTRPDEVGRVHREASESRRVAALALNAGIGVSGRFDQTDLEQHLRLVDLNCRSTVHLAGLVVRDMVAAGEGRVLVTSSIAAAAPTPWQATYAASKAFVHSFAEGIRHELKQTGVTVTSLMPGPTDTDFFSRADMEDVQIATGHKDDPDEVAKAGFEALMKGKDHVVSGSMRNKVQMAGIPFVPDALAAVVTSRVTKPGSGE
jgi:short-subunit dehydrogenase